MTMRGNEKAILKRFVCLPLITLALSGCATVEPPQIVQSGDKVGIHFICRLPNGEVAASTNPAIADDPAQPKSPVFLVKKDSKPVVITAGARVRNPGPGKELSFEYTIADRLADLVVGLPTGEWRKVAVTAGNASVTAGDPKSIQLTQVWVSSKEMRFTPEEFRKRTGQEPKPGEEFTYDPHFPGKVTAANDKEVVVRFSAAPVGVIETAFGRGTVKELPDRYEITMDVREGRLVRTGGFVGVISNVGDKTFTVDYSHPFGGKELTCAVKAEPAAVNSGKTSKE